MVAPVDIGDRDPFAITAGRAASPDDPFVRALRERSADGEPEATSAERTVTLVGPLAQRDPSAAPDESVDLQLTGAASFDEVFRRARRRGFLAGCAAGALAAASAAALLAARWTLPPAGTASSAPRPASVRDHPLGEDAAPAPAARAVDATPPPRAVDAPPGSLPPAGTQAGAVQGAPAAPVSRRPPAAVARKAPREARQDRAAAVGGGRGEEAPGLDLRAADADRAEGPPLAQPGVVAAKPPAPRVLGDGEVSAALEARRDALDGCAAAVAADADAAGRRFLLLVAIDPDGRVAEARVDDPAIHATALGTCLVRIAGEMSFAPFDGAPVRVELPLRFGGGDGEPAAR
jgi:hypothetical protein